VIWVRYIWRDVEFLCPPWQGNGSFEKVFPRLLRQGVAGLHQTPYGSPIPNQTSLVKGDKRLETISAAGPDNATLNIT